MGVPHGVARSHLSLLDSSALLERSLDALESTGESPWNVRDVSGDPVFGTAHLRDLECKLRKCPAVMRRLSFVEEVRLMAMLNENARIAEVTELPRVVVVIA